MNVLIVGRTKMSGSSRCIGGLAADGTSLRLLQSNGHNWDTTAPFQVGEIWDIAYTAVQAPTPPHIEDVLVSSATPLGTQPTLRDHLLSRIQPWQGAITRIFDGCVRYTGNNNGYVSSSAGVPGQSTGYWIPDSDLTLRGDGRHYDYPGWLGQRGLSYVGEPQPPAVLPAGTLLRVSLARWWKPDDAGADFEERCYVQLSGWFA